jgi:hypothetical protein
MSEETGAADPNCAPGSSTAPTDRSGLGFWHQEGTLLDSLPILQFPGDDERAQNRKSTDVILYEDQQNGARFLQEEEEVWTI